MEEDLQNNRLWNRGGHWRSDEDERLKALVAAYGPRNWNEIAEHMEGRTGKSCRLRWVNQLDPRIKKDAFTEEEDELLLHAYATYGSKWAKIARLFPGRTDNALKNHWHVIMGRRYRGEHAPQLQQLQVDPHNNSIAAESTGSNPAPPAYQLFLSDNKRVVHAEDSSGTMGSSTTVHNNKKVLHYSDLGLDEEEFSVQQQQQQQQQQVAADPNEVGSYKRDNVPKFIDFLGVGDDAN